MFIRIALLDLPTPGTPLTNKSRLYEYLKCYVTERNTERIKLSISLCGLLNSTILISTAKTEADLPACTDVTPTLLTKTTGVILSDHYDGATEYPSDLNCRWHIHAPRGKVITLYFDVISILSYCIKSYETSN